MTTHPRTFSDTFTSLEFRFSLGSETSTNCRYLSIPVSNGMVDYEEHYAIEDAHFHAWMREPCAALPMVIRCRRRQMDHALLMPPGANRGTSGERGFSVVEIATIMGRIAQLLRDGHCPSWASGIEDQRARLSHESDEVRRSILGMYGGMGSICDLVLYRDGVLLRQATDELHELLGWLHEWGARLV
ncbi:DUF6966 domain-containing protein [Pseudomonas sp. NUPR-001]|uniref:DUF6966 domain-containing protein n=1 Tax=Pseudomonas sp. NUPR-001 TaxID=3416058 RepID=UPI003F9B75C6